jgi:hypothetical protein
MENWNIIPSSGITRTVACWAGGALKDVARENIATVDLLWLIPPGPEDFQQLTQLHIAGYRVDFDHARAVVNHHGHHADPLFMIDRNGQACWEINLYQDGLLAADSVTLVFDNGQSQSVFLANAPYKRSTEQFQTHLADWPHQRTLVIQAAAEIELIWQIMRFGRFHEQRQLLAAGHHQINIPYFFADWLGLVISSRDLEGPIEHKYMLSGTLGAASARWLIDGQNGRIFAPPQAQEFAFRSAILSGLDSDLWPQYLAEFDEIEILLPVTATAPIGLGEKHRLTFYAPWDHPLAATADILCLDPGDDPNHPAIPHNTAISYLLLHDADAPDMMARYQTILAAQSVIADDRLWLDRAWLGARHDPGGDLVNPTYGIGFSFARAQNWYEEPAMNRARITEKTRFLRRSSPCYHCPEQIIASCRQSLPRPGPLLFPDGEQCLWRTKADLPTPR